jgi:3-oxoacyl-[acyl-carrier protein] reductase
MLRSAYSGFRLGRHGFFYAASKAGIHGLTRSFANMLAKEGITVNAIAPVLKAEIRGQYSGQ